MNTIIIESIIKAFIIKLTRRKESSEQLLYQAIKTMHLSIILFIHCYDFNSLADYAENANIIRIKFLKYIKQIFRNIQKILID